MVELIEHSPSDDEDGDDEKEETSKTGRGQ